MKSTYETLANPAYWEATGDLPKVDFNLSYSEAPIVERAWEPMAWMPEWEPVPAGSPMPVPRDRHKAVVSATIDFALATHYYRWSGESPVEPEQFDAAHRGYQTVDASRLAALARDADGKEILVKRQVWNCIGTRGGRYLLGMIRRLPEPGLLWAHNESKVRIFKPPAVGELFIADRALNRVVVCKAKIARAQVLRPNPLMRWPEDKENQ